MDILLSCIFTALSCGGFCYLGFYMGSRFKIVEIKDTEEVKIINNYPEMKQSKEFLYEEEEAGVPGDKDWLKKQTK